MKHVAGDGSSRWVAVETVDPLMSLENVDGEPWFEAPLPPRLHRCKAQTRGLLPTGLVCRCACGAISGNGHWWSQRNSRRRSERVVRPAGGARRAA